jgi:hypothetical protein
MNVYECTLVIADGIAETHAVGAAIELQVERIIGTQAATAGGVSDGDKGDITVSGSGTTWTVDARAITAAKLFEVGATKLLGRHAGTAGDAQEISVDGGLEFNGGQIRRSALTGDVTASAGDGVTTIASGVVSTAKMGGDVTTAGKALLDDVDAAAQRTTLGLGTAATSATGDFAAASHTHTLSNLTQSGATTGQVAQWDGTAWVPVTFSGGIGGSTGSTDNALLRADGTGGATVQSSSVSVEDDTTLSAAQWTVGPSSYSGRSFAKFCGVGSNISVHLGITGTGFLTWHMPDGTVAGGDNRGNNAVDFTYYRALAANIASGAGAVAFQRSRASGGDAFAIGSSIASGGYSFSGGQSNATASGTNSWTFGYGTISSGSYASSFGLFSIASGSFTTAHGERALATVYGQVSEGSGMFGATGDAQRSRLLARRSTTDATPSNLFSDGSSARVVVPANSSGRARITITARRATSGAETMTWTREVAWQRGVAASTVTVDVQTIGTDRGYTGGAWGAGPAWSIAITADTANGAIDISVTGAAATNIRWVASIEWVETTFA